MEVDSRAWIDLGIPLLLAALVLWRMPGQPYLSMLLFCLSIAWAIHRGRRS